MSTTLNLASSLVALARRWQSQARDADARRLLDRIPTCRASAATHLRLACLSLRQRHFRRARRHLVSALKMRPKDARARYLLARALERNPRTCPETVVRQYRLALRLDAQRPMWWAAYGRFLAQLGRVSAGLGALREAIALAPTDARLAAALVNTLARAGRFEEAEREARILRFTHPSGAAIWERLRFRQTLRRQLAERSRHATERPVLLPFLRPVDTTAPDRPVAGRILRRDHASRPVPHLPRRLRSKRAP